MPLSSHIHIHIRLKADMCGTSPLAVVWGSRERCFGSQLFQRPAPGIRRGPGTIGGHGAPRSHFMAMYTVITLQLAKKEKKKTV